MFRYFVSFLCLRFCSQADCGLTGCAVRLCRRFAAAPCGRPSPKHVSWPLQNRSTPPTGGGGGSLRTNFAFTDNAVQPFLLSGALSRIGFRWAEAGAGAPHASVRFGRFGGRSACAGTCPSPLSDGRLSAPLLSPLSCRSVAVSGRLPGLLCRSVAMRDALRCAAGRFDLRPPPPSFLRPLRRPVDRVRKLFRRS